MTTAIQNAERFLAALFEPTDIIELRLLPSRKQTWAESYFKVIDRWGEIEAANGRGENVYFGANPRKRSGGEAQDVALARCVFVDIDHEVNQRAIEKRLEEAGLPEPTALVMSGHGFQVWWRLAEPMTDMAAWSVVQRRLIAAVGSDPSIHDAPRIMRMPGTMNVKRAPHVEAVVCHAAEPGTGRVRLEDLEAVLPPPMTAERERAVRHERELLSGEKRPLAYATLEFIAHGAVDGERNHRLFRAACDLCGCGYSVDEAVNRLGHAATRCGLGDDEIQSTIASAYGKPRSPAKPPEVEMPEGWSAVPDEAVQPQNLRSLDRPAAQKSAAKPQNIRQAMRYGSDWVRDGGAEKPLFANAIHMRGGGDDEKSWNRHVPAERLASDLYEMTGKWPRIAGGQMFVPAVRPAEGDLPGTSTVHYIASTDDLFAWINHHADVLWTRKEVRSANKASRTALTKGEMLEYIKQHPGGWYESVELIPHEPPVDKAWYAPCELPDDGGQALAAIVERLNAETDIDRVLMLAALLTGGWGGSPGSRPAMLYTSDHGRGVGKTSTAMIAAQIWGLSIQLNAKDDWDKAMGRMLSEQAMAGRAVLIDNVKGRVDSDKLDALLTSPVIEGWRPYVGHATRPNRLLVLVTSNQPRLSADLAARAIVIRVGQSKWQDAGFGAWVTDHIDSRRAAIVAACLKILKESKESGVGAVSTANRDRWGRWQDGPLAAAVWACENVPGIRAVFDAGVPTLDAVAAEVIRRREGVDDDAASADDLADEIVAALAAAGLKASDSVHIPLAVLASILTREGGVAADMSPRQINGWVASLAGTGALKALHKSRPGSGGDGRRQRVPRGWRWSVADLPATWCMDKPGSASPFCGTDERAAGVDPNDDGIPI